jgi:hypothetical protein
MQWLGAKIAELLAHHGQNQNLEFSVSSRSASLAMGNIVRRQHDDSPISVVRTEVRLMLDEDARVKGAAGWRHHVAYYSTVAYRMYE